MTNPLPALRRRLKDVSRAEKTVYLSLLVAAIAAAAVLFFFDPVTTFLFPVCPLHAATGLYCPGCGSSRAAYLILHGDIAGAFRKNALLFAAVPFLIGLVAWPRLARARYTPLVALVVLLAYGILRNIPVWPFILLAPH